MTRTEIVEQLRYWIKSGAMLGKPNTGLSYAEINRKIAAKEFFPTEYDSIVFTDLEACLKFRKLVDSGRIMNGSQCRIKRGLLTLYAINTACANGELLRFAEIGKKITLYIN